MDKVLIALDYDPTAREVAETGHSLAKTMGAETILLHVISVPGNYDSTEYSSVMGFTGYHDSVQAQLDNIQELKKVSQQFLDQVKHHLADDKIKILVKEGDSAKAILQAAKEVHADIIVMGSHSQKWLQNIVMGSVTENVMKHTSLPMFIVSTRKNK